MTTIETINSLELYSGTYNPYDISGDSLRIFCLTDKLSQRQPYIDGSTNPDIGTRSIYILDGSDPISDIARQLEGEVLSSSKDWGMDKNQIQQDAQSYEANSSFFVLTDKDESGKTVVVGSLRIADCEAGPSETVEFYKNHFQTEDLPEEIDLTADNHRVWDIVGVMIDPERRNGEESAWLYYAMHKKSTEEGIKKWISNITDKEIRNLKKHIGIPFEEISTGQRATLYNPKTQTHIEFGFYTADAPNVAVAVERNVEELEIANGAKRAIARIAMIGLWGSVTRPTSSAVSKTDIPEKVA